MANSIAGGHDTRQNFAMEAGFQQPVFDSQRCFRTLMDAFAHPGTIYPVEVNFNAPQGISSVAAAIALTLSDADCSVWLCDSTLAKFENLPAWLQFQTDCVVVSSPKQADFVYMDLVDARAESSLDRRLQHLTQFRTGTAEYPDRSATLILTLDSLAGGEKTLQLSGPGIMDKQLLSPGSLPDDLLLSLEKNHAQFPLGLDYIFCDQSSIAVVPRSSKVLIMESSN